MHSSCADLDTYTRGRMQWPTDNNLAQVCRQNRAITTAPSNLSLIESIYLKAIESMRLAIELHKNRTINL